VRLSLTQSAADDCAVRILAAKLLVVIHRRTFCGKVTERAINQVLYPGRTQHRSGFNAVECQHQSSGQKATAFLGESCRAAVHGHASELVLAISDLRLGLLSGAASTECLAGVSNYRRSLRWGEMPYMLGIRVAVNKSVQRHLVEATAALTHIP
jgi:hypothetical protein